MRFIAVPLVLVLALVALSCGSGGSDSQPSTVDTTATSAHDPSPQVKDQIVADATADLNLIASSGKDTSVLPQALKGTALQNTTDTINQDLAAGKYKKRDYQNLQVRLDDYNYPIAQVVAEFDDNSYYVDANSGQALSQPTGQHMTFDLALVEEEGRWKIQGIFLPSNANTPTTPIQER